MRRGWQAGWYLALGFWLLMAASGRGEGPPQVDTRDRTAGGERSYRASQMGAGALSYWLFEPESTAAGKAPVIVFLHGWLATNPAVYGAWLEHLVRRGAIVIYPRYHADWLTPPTSYLPNALRAIHDVLDVLQAVPGHVRPDLDRFALIGHSAGGNLAAQVAAVSQEAGLPRPRAVLAFMPGEVRPVPGPDLGKIPAETLLVVAAAEQDLVVGDARARAIFRAATSISEDRKLYVLYRSDRLGWPPVIADHFAPCASESTLDNGEGPFRTLQLEQARLDRLDLLGIWRLTDLTLAAAFESRTLAEVARLGGQPLEDLGNWPDGREVRRPIMGTRLDDIPRVIPSHGARLIDWSWPDQLLPALTPVQLFPEVEERPFGSLRKLRFLPPLEAALPRF